MLGLAACGGTTTTTTTNSAGQTVVSCQMAFAKTKFVLHAGLALAAFDRYLYQPFRAGAFKQGAPGRTKALLKAAASSVFIYHELTIAAQDARCDTTLRKLMTPLTSAAATLSSLKAALTGGNVNALTGAVSQLTGLRATAQRYGVGLG